MPISFKLQNVLLHVDDHAAKHPELYYRTAAGSASVDAETGALVCSAPIDFLTYLNGLSIGKWRRYAGIRNPVLHIELAGAGDLRIEGIPASTPIDPDAKPSGPDPERTVICSHEFSGTLQAPAVLDVAVAADDMDLIGFAIEPSRGGTVSIARAWWSCEVDPSEVNEVRLAIATTTFKKEAYITANIDLVQQAVRAEGAPIMGNFHMFVVDNGRTLDVDALSDDLVTVLPNPNVGGSGGFARGMMAATEVEGAFTHVLVMDDDVRIVPESLIRTFNLLSLACGAYRDAFLNGAMLSLEHPTRQFEDVAFVNPTGVYAKVKRDFDVSRLFDICANERKDVEVPGAYGAWWFSCIPTSAIRANGLPMPFFIRCDDVEFGARNKPVYMCMNGICVWHESFEGRFRASVDCYQYARNFLAMIAVDDCADERLFVLRLRRNVRQQLRDLDYTAAELMLDGFADYLKGPKFLEEADGGALMMSNGRRNEKVVSVGDMDPGVLAQAGVTEAVLSSRSMEFHSTLWRKLVTTLPYDKHYLPDFLLRSRPGYAVKNGAATLEGDSARCRTIVYLDPTREKGAVRTMDKGRFAAIRKCERELLKTWRRDGKAIRASWKAEFPRMTSRSFWEEYLAARSE